MSSISIYNLTDETYHMDPEDVSNIEELSGDIRTSSAFMGIVLSLTVALILLSTKQQRKSPDFILLSVAFPATMAYNLLCQIQGFWQYDSKFLMPNQHYPYSKEGRLRIISLTLEHWTPLLANFAVLFKLVSFYPTHMYTAKERLQRIFPACAILSPRILLVLLATYEANQVWRNSTIVEGKSTLSVDLATVHRYVVVATFDYAFQAGFCFYASCLLLYKMSQSYMRMSKRHLTVKVRFRCFINMCIMTYMIPFALALLCAVQINKASKDEDDFRDLAAALVNTSVICALLATTWSNINIKTLKGDESDLPKLPLIVELYNTTQPVQRLHSEAQSLQSSRSSRRREDSDREEEEGFQREAGLSLSESNTSRKAHEAK